MHKKRPANENAPLSLEVEVAERTDAPGNWTVEAVDLGSEGEVYQAIFVGPKAKERAYSYAEREYGFGVGSAET